MKIITIFGKGFNIFFLLSFFLLVYNQSAFFCNP